MDRTKVTIWKDECCSNLAEEIYEDSCGKKDIDKTPQCEQHKEAYQPLSGCAKYISGADNKQLQ